MKFIHAADLHLRAADASEQLQALKIIVHLAAEHDADFLLFAGDLFDSDHDADRLRPQVRQVLEVWGRPVVLVPGNHDARSYGSTADYGDKALLAQGDMQVERRRRMCAITSPSFPKICRTCPFATWPWVTFTGGSTTPPHPSSAAIRAPPFR